MLYFSKIFIFQIFQTTSWLWEHFMMKLTMHHFIKSLSLSSTRGTSSENLNQKLYLEALQTKWWLSKLCLFYKIVYNCLLTCPAIFLVLTEFITRDMQLIFQRLNLHILLKESNIPSTVTKWNKSNNDIHNTENYILFRWLLLSFITKSVFIVNNTKWIKCLTKL